MTIVKTKIGTAAGGAVRKNGCLNFAVRWAKSAAEAYVKTAASIYGECKKAVVKAITAAKRAILVFAGKMLGGEM